mgnify:CR=1 FL=1
MPGLPATQAPDHAEEPAVPAIAGAQGCYSRCMDNEKKNTLHLRRIAIDTYKENVVYLHRDCQTYRSEGFQALAKVEITSGLNSSSVLAVLNVVDDAAITAPGQLGLSEEPFPGAESTLPWLDEQANLRKEKNFFETRVTEYQTGGALNWD